MNTEKAMVAVGRRIRREKAISKPADNPAPLLPRGPYTVIIARREGIESANVRSERRKRLIKTRSTRPIELVLPW